MFLLNEAVFGIGNGNGPRMPSCLETGEDEKETYLRRVVVMELKVQPYNPAGTPMNRG